MDTSASTSPLYNIGVVTRITGVPIATLYAWERRYGFPDAIRTAGGHRLYRKRTSPACVGSNLRWILD